MVIFFNLFISSCCLYFFFLFYSKFFFLLAPLVPPLVLPFSFGEDAADVGEIASATCVVPKGDLPLEIHWSLNSAPIVNSENGFSILRLNKRTSSLNIDSLNALHRGIYKCIATNQAGTSEYTAELQVNGWF